MASPSLAGLFEQKVVVGIADMAVSNNQSLTLATYSLGSCIGVTIYDPVAKVGGLLHVMLPESSIDMDKAQRQPAMFMDTGIPALFRAAYELARKGGRAAPTPAEVSEIEKAYERLLRDTAAPDHLIEVKRGAFEKRREQR